MLDQFKALVEPIIYRRGERYYADKRISFYEITPNGPVFQVNARVEGTYIYSVHAKIGLKQNKLIYRGNCNCKYDQGICKHQVAVMMRFFERDFERLKPSIVAHSMGFHILENFMDNISMEPISMEYRVKGLLSPNMVNFSVILSSAELAEHDLLNLVSFIHDEWQRPLQHFKFKATLDETALQVLEFLRKSHPRSSKVPGSVLIPKTPGNFAFIFNLAKQARVVCVENGRKIIPGKTIQPTILVSGTEDQVTFTLSQEGFQIHGNQNKENPVAWTMIEDYLHPVNIKDLNSLPAKVLIPEDKKGKFLFEVLPDLEKKLQVRLSEELQDYELNRIYPEIFLELDYEDGMVVLETKMHIGDREIQGVDTLGLLLEDSDYQRSEENPRMWSGVDRATVNEYIRFLEENEFVISKGRFIIKDEEHLQNFITGGFPHIPEEWHVTTTAQFDELEVVPIELEPIVEITTGGEIDWFDFSVTYNLGGETFTHQEILSRIKRNSQGENFIRIGNRYFVIYNDDKRRIIDENIHLAKDSKNKYQSQFYNLLYYRNLFLEKGIDFSGDKTFNELQEDISGEKILRNWEIPGEVENVLRNYQKTGYYWLRFLHKYHLGGILADDMGLGKTLQVLTLLKGVEPGEPSLVVCPKTLLYNWAAEIDKFFPDLKYLVYYGNPNERLVLQETIEQYDIIITTYAIIGRDVEILRDRVFAFCILDEAQQIKNYRTKRAEGVKNIRARYRLVLTGTPIENSIEELWSLFDFLMSGYLDTPTSFRKHYLVPIKENNDQRVLTELKRRVAPFILRRNKSEVLVELPEKIEQVAKVEMTKLQEDAYLTILSQVRQEILSTVQLQGFQRSHINILAALTKLRQICDHPQLLLGDLEEKVTSGKIEALLEIVSEAISSGHKVLVFSQFVKMLRIIEREFKEASITYEYLDGSTKNRMERVNRFNEDPAISTFLISLKAGGTGLNLTAADIVIHVDPWWNPMVENQATDRVHRIGQVNKVLVYKLITRGTVEEKMLKLQERKRSIFNAMIEETGDVIEHLTWEDVQELFEM